MEIDWPLYHWHLEPSSVCTLKCPRCPRTEFPNTPWINKNMSLADVKLFLTTEILKTKVKRITMCGDVGDPIYCTDYLKICKYIKETNPLIHIVTITNGSHKKPAWWDALASILNEHDSINFSIDGFDNTSNNLYRVNSNFDSIINGIRAFREQNTETFLTWALIVFNFNEHHLDKIKDIAIGLKMDTIQITKSTKFGSKYGNAYGGNDDALEPSPKWISSSDRYERSVIRISDRIQDTTVYMKQNEDLYNMILEKYKDSHILPLCEIGNRGIYINAEGVVFPCSWTSFPYDSLSHGDKTINWKDSFFATYRSEMNIHNHSFDNIINNKKWNLCSSGWNDKNKTWVECSQKCNKHVVDKNYAVGWETN